MYFSKFRGVENIVFSYFGAFEGPSCAPSDSREKVSMCHFKEIETYFQNIFQTQTMWGNFAAGAIDVKAVACIYCMHILHAYIAFIHCMYILHVYVHAHIYIYIYIYKCMYIYIYVYIYNLKSDYS